MRVTGSAALTKQMAYSRIIGLVLAVCWAASAAANDAYKVDPGSFEIVAVEIELPFPELDKQLPLRIAYPGTPGQYPVIVFSHGGGCPKDMYLRLSDHWASHGYVVISPVHADSRSLLPSFAGLDPKTLGQLIYNRRYDMQQVLNSLDTIEAQAPELAGQLDRNRLVAAGHSMGGATAMAVTGLVLEDSSGRFVDRFDEDRFDVLLLIGDPGNRDFMPEGPWRAIALPTLIVTGSNDYGQKFGGGPMKLDFPDGIEFADTPNHYVFITDMDHYMGGLICRSDVSGPLDYDAVAITRSVSTAFLDAYAKDDDEARRFLSSDELPGLTDGRATLEER